MDSENNIYLDMSNDQIDNLLLGVKLSKKKKIKKYVNRAKVIN